jgi:cytochrome c553
MACHGPQGNSGNPDWPKLAGQHANYLARQLQAFKSGARKDPLMGPQAVALSDDDINDLAAYFAAQKQK